MKKILIYFTIILCTAFNACTIDEIDTFSTEDYAYFDIDDQEGKLIGDYGYILQQYTFALESDQNTTEKTVTYPVTFAGSPKSNDRYVSVVVIDSLTTATEGLHFDLMSDSENIIPAGEMIGKMALKVYKTEDMDTERYQIALNIVDNDLINAGPKKKLLLTVSNQFEKPNWWYDDPWSNEYIGEYTVTKCRLWMIFHDVLDGSDPWGKEPYVKWTYSYWSEKYIWVPVSSKRLESIRLFALWLAEGDENGDPYIDENGIEVLSTL